MPPTTTDPLETATAESADALATMESEAADYFAARDAERTALNPVAPALERATRSAPLPATGKPAAAPAPNSRGKQAVSGTPVEPAKTLPKPASAAKVPGAPRMAATGAATAPVAKEGAVASPPPSSADAAAPGTPPADFSDVPREYTPGKTRAPHWDKLHAKADHYESLATQRAAELETLRAELEAARASTSTTPPPDVAERLTALQTERDSLRTQLQAVAGERIFDAESKPRREAAITQAKQVAGPEHAARIEQLLALGESTYRDNAIEELISTLPPLRAAKLTAAVADLDRLASERAAAAAQGGELWNRRMSEATAAQERAAAERNAAATRTFDAEVAEWQSAGIVTPEDIENARSVYSGKGSTLQDAARASLWAAAGPKLAQQAQDALARVAELEGELSKLRGAQPGVGAAASGALPSAATDEDDPSTTGYAERIARVALQSGVRFGPTA